MKKMLLALLAITSVHLSEAQNRQNILDKFPEEAKKWRGNFLKMGEQPKAKTTAITQRLIGNSQYNQDISNPWYIVDSNFYKYSGYRGSHIGYNDPTYLFGPLPQVFSSYLLCDTSLYYFPPAPDVKGIYIYNAANQLTQHIEQKKNGSVFENSTRILAAYDAQGNMTSSQYDFWDASTNQWVISMKNKAIYNTQGEIIADTILDVTTGLAIGYNSYSYNSSGLMVQQLTKYWDGAGWADQERFNYTYTSSGKIKIGVSEQYNGVNWEIVVTDSLAYNAFDILNYEEFSYWAGGSVVHAVKFERTINASTLLPDEIYTYSINGTQWTLVQKDVNTFNSYQNAVKTDWYDANNYHWGIIHYYYELYDNGISSVGNTSNKSYQIFPNPVINQLNITSSQTIDHLTIKIFNITGQLEYQDRKQKVKNLSITLPNIPAGNYFLQLNDGKTVYNHRFIKQ